MVKIQCPHCDGEFEWSEESKARVRSDSEPMSGIKAGSHAIHGAGGLMLLIGMFSGWLTVGGFLDASPFGMKASLYGFSESTGWFNFFGDGGDSVLALEVSMQMAYISYQYRWHTSLIALACSVAGVVVMEIGLIIAFGMELAFPRPSLFGIFLLLVLVGQFVMMNQELAEE